MSKASPGAAFIVDKARIRRNLEILVGVKERTGCRILLALKGFALWRLAPLISQYLDGVCASSPWEARLGDEEFDGEVHAFAAALSEADVLALRETASSISFNSFAQWRRFRSLVEGRLECGLRINPQCSTQAAAHALYDPCAPGSRLGIPAQAFAGQSLDGLSGLHFHSLCEQDAGDLATTLAAVEEQFGSYLQQESMRWCNFGGGHHITRPGYDIELLCRLITDFQEKYGLRVYLEPGEAVALNSGLLTGEVLDIVHNGMDIAILNLSCTDHMPDVLEMPYRPQAGLTGEGIYPLPERLAGAPGELPHHYRLAGCSCLAGDVVGDYSFHRPLTVGDRLAFLDMAHYTMVKTSMFNGIQHPDIVLVDTEQDSREIVRRFDYEDFKARLS